MADHVNILTPVGRLVQGSLYVPQTTNAEGQPLVVKTGLSAGQPRVDFFFALAIPKGAEKGWHETAWGQLIVGVGYAAFPQAARSPDFAWKVQDGDSQVPNKKGRKPCEREGYPGHWVLNFSSGFAPKIYNSDGTQQILEPNAVKLGSYVQVSGTVAGNGSTSNPGVFLNHSMLALAGYGPEIVVGPDAASVGFGQGVALPAGASATPVGGAFNPTPAPTPGAYAPAPSAPAPYAAPAAIAPAPYAAPAAIAPNPAFLAVPPVVSAPVPPAPAAPVTRVMSAKANGASYEACIAAGWTDATLAQNGMFA